MVTPMTHAQARRKQLALIPKFWQPKAAPSRQLTTSIYHWDILSKFTSGEADAQTMWAWIEAALVYSEMTRRFIEDGVPVADEAVQAIDEQLEIVAKVIDRFAISTCKDTQRLKPANPQVNHYSAAFAARKKQND